MLKKYSIISAVHGAEREEIMKATNIKWDVDDENELEDLPTEIIIPSNIEDDEEAISDYLSDVTGFCHKRFELVSQ